MATLLCTVSDVSSGTLSRSVQGCGGRCFLSVSGSMASTSSSEREKCPPLMLASACLNAAGEVFGANLHRAYPIFDPSSAANFMTVRDRPTDVPQIIPRSKWHFVLADL